eukprot:1156424-Pelagomonas_calceolata.AAC.4
MGCSRAPPSGTHTHTHPVRARLWCPFGPMYSKQTQLFMHQAPCDPCFADPGHACGPTMQSLKRLVVGKEPGESDLDSSTTKVMLRVLPAFQPVWRTFPGLALLRQEDVLDSFHVRARVCPKKGTHA